MNTVEEEIRELLQRRAERLDRPDLGMPERVVRRARRRATATMAGALLVAAALAAGGYVGVNQLASSSLHGTRPATPPPHHSPAVTPPAPSSSPPSGTPPPVGVSACSRGQLALSDQTQGAAGSVLGSLVITNVSASPCTMSGHPRVALIDANGSPLAVSRVETLPWWNVNRTGKPPGWPVVTLQPRASAAIRVRWSNWCGAARSAAWSVPLPWLGVNLPPEPARGIPPCNGPGQPSTLEVGPFEPNPPA